MGTYLLPAVSAFRFRTKSCLSGTKPTIRFANKLSAQVGLDAAQRMAGESIKSKQNPAKLEKSVKKSEKIAVP